MGRFSNLKTGSEGAVRREGTYRLNAPIIHQFLSDNGRDIPWLARRIYKAEETVERWLKGRPVFIKNLSALAKVLNKSVQEVSIDEIPPEVLALYPSENQKTYEFLTVKLPKEKFSTWGFEKQSKIIEGLQSLLSTCDRVHVESAEKGCVKLTIRVTSEQAAELRVAHSEGRLAALGISELTTTEAPRKPQQSFASQTKARWIPWLAMAWLYLFPDTPTTSWQKLKSWVLFIGAFSITITVSAGACILVAQLLREAIPKAVKDHGTAIESAKDQPTLIKPISSTVDQQSSPPTVTAAQIVSPSTGMEFVLVPAGRGWYQEMEPLQQDNLPPLTPITIAKPFYFGKYEVTQKEWKSVMGTSPWQGQMFAKDGPRVAASYITWDDAVLFCKKLSMLDGRKYRLPSQMEWEYACRAGTSTKYFFGEQGELDDFAWNSENSADENGVHIHEVGQKKPNKWNLYDMYGNVWEWTLDSQGADSQGEDQQIIRGGCIDNPAKSQPGHEINSSFRWFTKKSPAMHGHGFRVLAE